MKHSFIILSLSIWMTACQQEKAILEANHPLEQEVTKLEKQKKSLTDRYQLTSPFVQYYQDEGKPLDPVVQNSFIASSGLPLEAAASDWLNNHTITEAIDIYQNFINTNQRHQFINTFKQYEGWLMLSRFELLSLSSVENGNAVKMITQQLVDSKYKGYELMYYALKYLRDNKFASQKEIIGWATGIKQYAPSSAPITTEEEFKGSKPLSPGAVEAIAKYRNDEAIAFRFIKQITSL